MRLWAAVAAANNAEWCDAVCRTHGVATDADGSAWTSRTRSPPLYPDAVTLVPDTSVVGLLARIDNSRGCSIKDSFASLDLAGYGFQILFDAQWIVREPAKSRVVAPGPRWMVVSGADAFVSWERAWRGQDGPVDVLRRSLLSLASVTMLAELVDDRMLVPGQATSRCGEAPCGSRRSCWCDRWWFAQRNGGRWARSGSR